MLPELADAVRERWREMIIMRAEDPAVRRVMTDSDY